MSAPAARALYRGLWRQVRRFQEDALPITGVVGLDAGPVCINPLARLRAAFGGGGEENRTTTPTATSLSDGLRALRALPQQAAALEHAEEDARALLARWAELQARWAELRRGSGGATAATTTNTRVLEAGEEASALAYAATEEQAAERALDDDEADERRARARRVLELARSPGARAAADLVVQARAAAATAARGDNDLSSRYPSARVRAASAASAALFTSTGDAEAGRLRSEPVEWVYDGVEAALPQPLLAGEAAWESSGGGDSNGNTSSGPPSRAARKGVPLALALAAARCLADAQLPGVARCEPVCARDREEEMLAAGRAEQGGSSAGGPGGAAIAALSALPPAVAARQAGRTVAAAPATNTWLVRLDIVEEDQEGGESGGGGQRGPRRFSSWFVDVTRKGELLSPEEASARYPGLLQRVGGANNDDDKQEEERAVLALWRELARTLALAHQRRGEADSVAAWVRCLLALDPGAAEWSVALPDGAV